jgi:hypothetical protein
MSEATKSNASSSASLNAINSQSLLRNLPGPKKYLEITTLNNSLLMAVNDRDIKKVEAALKAGAYANSKDDNGTSALMSAAYAGDTKIMEFLIDKGAYVDAARGDGWTALMAAVWNCHYDAVKLLAGRGADPNVRYGKGGKTALMVAAKRGETKIAELLIESGAQVNAKNADRYTALIYAQVEGYGDTIALLRSHGAVE